MTLPNFPTLSQNPTVADFGHQAEDPVRRSDAKDGALLVHARTTNSPIGFTINYPALSDTDKEALEVFVQDTLGNSGLRFAWTNPDPNDNKPYVVVLSGPINYQLHPQSSGDLWQVSFEILAIRRRPLLFGSGLFGEGLMGEL